MKRLFSFSLAFFLILFDQLTKAIILRFFPQLASFNQGISFGLFPSNWWLAINLLIIFLLVFFFQKENRKKTIEKRKEKKKIFPWLLIIAGGLSNIIDRLFREGVVDFIDFSLIPSFNLADVFICSGVAILIFNRLKITHRNTPKKPC